MQCNIIIKVFNNTNKKIIMIIKKSRNQETEYRKLNESHSFISLILLDVILLISVSRSGILCYICYCFIYVVIDYNKAVDTTWYRS